MNPDRTTRQESAAGTSNRQDSQPLSRVLITGGSGFIGTNVAAYYASRNVPVLIYDNLSRPGVERNLDWLKKTFGRLILPVIADVRDEEAIGRAVKGCSAVFHFAAQVAVTTSLDDPQTDFAINAQGSLNVLEACRRLQTPPPLLFTSTNKVYGKLGGLPLLCQQQRYLPVNEDVRRYGIDESQPIDLYSPYGCSKGVADQYMIDYARCYGLPTVVFRMSCIYGPHQCGTEDQGWVAHFARNVLESEPITFYGDGRQVRDLLFVEDLVRAMSAAVANIDQVRGRAFNIGGGPPNAASLLDVIDLLAELHHQSAQIRTSEWRKGDQRFYVSDTRAFQQVAGWQPQYSVKQGIGRLYHWLRKQHLPLATTAS